MNLHCIFFLQVPDPINADFSLAEQWQKMQNSSNLANQNAVNIYTVGESPLLTNLGISSLSLKTIQVNIKL